MRRLSLLAAAVITALPALASAGTINATLTGVGLNQIVTARYNGTDYAVYAGQLNWSTSDSTLGPTFQTFCIEFTQDVYIGSSYTYSTLSDIGMAPYPYVAPTGTIAGGMSTVDGLGTTRDKETLIRQLWGQYYNSTHDGIAIGAYTDSIETAAFQVAIWKILYETSTNAADQTSLTSGSFELNNGGLVAAEASNYLTWLLNNPDAGMAVGFTALSSPTAQDQLYFGGTTSRLQTPSVPVPSSAIAGSGLLAALGFKRLRRR